MELISTVIGLVVLIIILTLTSKLNKILTNQKNLDKKLDIISKNQGVIEGKLKK